MDSDNPFGADNQQERPSSTDWLDRIPNDLGNWVAGFVDGEGSFNVPVRRERDRGLPWRVSLSFNVSQIGVEAPMLLRNVFDLGTVRGRGDGGFYFEVTRPTEFEQRVSRSSIGSSCAVRNGTILRSSVWSLNLSCQAGTCHPRASKKPSH